MLRQIDRMVTVSPITKNEEQSFAAVGDYFIFFLIVPVSEAIIKSRFEVL